MHYESFLFLINGHSSGTFLSASDDSSGVLHQIEEKIARATMIPKEHGEVLHYWFSIFQLIMFDRSLIGQVFIQIKTY